jgi:hypothetical protein
LRRIEDQAALLADNPQCGLDLERAQTFLNEKSTVLMTAAIKFLNSALVYFSEGFFGKQFQGVLAYTTSESFKHRNQWSRDLSNHKNAAQACNFSV